MRLVLFLLMAAEAHAYTPVAKPHPVGADELLSQWEAAERMFSEPGSLHDGMYSAALKKFCNFLATYRKNYKSEMYAKYFTDTERKFKTLLDDANVLYTYSLIGEESAVTDARVKVASDVAAWENLEVAAVNWTNESNLKIMLLFVVLFLLFLLAVIWYAFQLEKSKVRERETGDLNVQILQAQEVERSRLSRELHDTVAQNMKYSAFLASRIPSPELAEEIRSNQDACIEQLRAICYNLSPPDIDIGDLKSAIEMLCGTFRKTYGLDVKLSFFEGTNYSFLSNDEMMNLYRIVQECLNNIAHHAKATEVSVLLRNSNENDTLAVFITDDGCGMNDDLVRKLNALSGKITTTDGSEHFGVRSMKERIRLLGGTLVYNSMPGEGTEVTIQVPVKRKKEKKRLLL